MEEELKKAIREIKFETAWEKLQALGYYRIERQERPFFDTTMRIISHDESKNICIDLASIEESLDKLLWTPELYLAVFDLLCGMGLIKRRIKWN